LNLTLRIEKKGGRYMWNIIIGIIFIIGGLSGKLVLRGTNSGMALAALGGALVIWGIIQLVKTKRNTGE